MGDVSKDEFVRTVAEAIAGLQVPVSMSMPLGEADAPIRKLLGFGFGWRTPDEIEQSFRENVDWEA